MRIDRQCFCVSRLIGILQSAESAPFASDPIHPPAWPSRLFDIQGSFRGWPTHAALLLPHAAPEVFSQWGEDDVLGRRHAPRLSCIRDPEGRFCKPRPLLSNRLSLREPSSRGYCVWVGSWTTQVITYPGEENLLSLACESLPGSPSSEPPCRRLNPSTGPGEIASFCRVNILPGIAVVYHSVAAYFCA